jgi:hypothetical protein
MAEVSMDYAVVESMAEGFRGAAESLQSVNRALETAAAILRASAFVGMVGNLALAEYLDNIQPNVARLAATCDELNSDLLGAVASLRDGDLSGSQRFIDGGGRAGASGNPTGPPGHKVGTAVAASFSNYQDGVNGWQLISMNGSFTPNELLSQGMTNSCTIYGAMNLLVENGYDISQADADRIYRINRDANLWIIDDVWEDMQDGSHDSEGFSTLRADFILGFYGADFDHDDFSTWGGLGSPERGDAEKFLIKQVTAGNPVYVSTEIDDTFGLGSGGHAYTVVGVQTDANGRLSSVLVSNNWGPSGASEIPAKQFMDDWMDYNDGEYIIVEH